MSQNQDPLKESCSIGASYLVLHLPPLWYLQGSATASKLFGKAEADLKQEVLGNISSQELQASEPGPLLSLRSSGIKKKKKKKWGKGDWKRAASWEDSRTESLCTSF